VKSFDDFRATLTPDVIDEIVKEVNKNIQVDLDNDPPTDSADAFTYVEQTFTISFTIRLLEKYHIWLAK